MTDRTEAGARRAAPRPIDWRHAAELLAGGMPIATVARRLGCSRSQLSRKRHHDPAFQRLLEDGKQTAPVRELDRIADLRLAVRAGIEAELKAGNVRVILWLADRLKLITPLSERTPEQELRTLLGGLSPDELQEFEGLRDTP
jgi:DNA invertase Pin-like site-specific DNA recombinase